MLKTSEYHGRNHVNSILYSETGTSPKMVVLGTSAAVKQHFYWQCALMYRNGFMYFKFQALLPNYTDSTGPAEYTTVDVLEYEAQATKPQRFFIQSPFWILSNQNTNELLNLSTMQSVGSFYLVNRNLVQKGYGEILFFENPNLTFPMDFVFMNTTFLYSKAPALLSGGVYTNEAAVRIPARCGMLGHFVNLNTKYFHSGAVVEGGATRSYVGSSDSGINGRIIDLKRTTSTAYFYEQYNVIVGFNLYNMVLDVTYGVIYDDNTEEHVTILKADQPDNVNGWFQINATGTTITAVDKPAIKDCDADADTAATSQFLHNLPSGSKLVPNASNKKIRYVYVSTTGGGTNKTSDKRDILLGLVLSPKTPNAMLQAGNNS
ncbi:MAG: hypothetical protein ACRCXT_00535 [Paraclostridium sp.]